MAIVALAIEAHTLACRRHELEIRVSGPGPAAAIATLEACLDLRPRLVLSWGIAGALRADLRSGDLIRPGSVVTEDGTHYGTAAPHEPDHCLASVSKPLRDPGQRQRLAARTGAMAVDMESAAMAAICQREHIPFRCLRAIADDMQQRLPVWLDAGMKQDGRLAVGATALGLLRHPWDLPDLIRAGRGLRPALRRLEQEAVSLEL